MNRCPTFLMLGFAALQVSWAHASSDGRVMSLAVDRYYEASGTEGGTEIPYLAIVDDSGASCWAQGGKAAADLTSADLTTALSDSKPPCAGPVDEKLAAFEQALETKIALKSGQTTVLMLAVSPKVGICPPCEALYPRAIKAAEAASVNWIRLEINPPAAKADEPAD